MTNEANVLTDVIEKYGKEHQCMIAIEEMSELMKSLCKHYRGRPNIEDIAEDIADMSIMLMELELMFDCTAKVIAYRDYKLRCLRSHLDNTKGDTDVNE